MPLLVRHRNSAPELQFTSSEDLLDDSVLEGVFSATPKHGSDQQLTGLTLELEEDAEIFIELPGSLYSDIDLSIDPAEQLTYSFLTEENLPFTLDPNNLSISGNTDGLGLQAVGGRSSWSTNSLLPMPQVKPPPLIRADPATLRSRANTHNHLTSSLGRGHSSAPCGTAGSRLNLVPVR